MFNFEFSWPDFALYASAWLFAVALVIAFVAGAAKADEEFNASFGDQS